MRTIREQKFQVKKTTSTDRNYNVLLDEIRFKADAKAMKGYPFELPLVQSISSISFPGPVTFFIGENGSGKSTILEVLATSTRLSTVGVVPYDDVRPVQLTRDFLKMPAAFLHHLWD